MFTFRPCSTTTYTQVQLELLFGAIFLRALSQLKREGDEDLRRSKEEAEEDEEEEGEGEDDGARAGGWRSPTQRREQPAVHAADADAQGVRRVFRDRELEVSVEVYFDISGQVPPAKPSWSVELETTRSKAAYLFRLFASKVFAAPCPPCRSRGY